MVETCAAVIMDTVPLVMRNIRTEMRSHRTPDLFVERCLLFDLLLLRPGRLLATRRTRLPVTVSSRR